MLRCVENKQGAKCLQIVNNFCILTLIISPSYFSYYRNINRDEDDYDDFYFDDVNRETERSHSEIINRFNISNSHLINARLSLHHSLFQSSNIPPVSTTRHNTRNYFPQELQDKSYSTLLRLISGSIIGDSSSNEVTPRFQSKDNMQSIPTFSSIAWEVENNQGTKLDKK